MSEYRSSIKIAIIGGTGALGTGLALRWARAGHKVTIGSRDGARAAVVAKEQSAIVDVEIAGLENSEAAANGDIVVMTVPYASHPATL